MPTARPLKAGRGGILGHIPINYAVAKQRTGWYYLPKVMGCCFYRSVQHLLARRSCWLMCAGVRRTRHPVGQALA